MGGLFPPCFVHTIKRFGVVKHEKHNFFILFYLQQVCLHNEQSLLGKKIKSSLGVYVKSLNK
jgi:hypothetical protein